MYNYWQHSASVNVFPFSLPVEKLQSLSDEKWSAFISQLCSFLEQQKPSAHPSSTTSAHAAQPTDIRSRLNLLCYLCNVVQHEVIANRLINSALVGKCQVLGVCRQPLLLFPLTCLPFFFIVLPVIVFSLCHIIDQKISRNIYHNFVQVSQFMAHG